jgi:gamma-glutamyl:cysteine ligase YbdK (ATP-grasp superfamily)
MPDATEGAELMVAPWRLFEVTGLEIELMIVDAETLSVAPLADRLLGEAAGVADASDVDHGLIGWSNELALHVIELKTGTPTARLTGVGAAFQTEVELMGRILEPLGARLLPAGMHPWMDPAELRLWPHGYDEVYRAYDRIFGCRGHGWANLQSIHINLPFADDRELHRLHAAIRAILPVIPALAASSPICEGAHRGRLDERLGFYRENSRRIPSITGQVIPEPIRSRAEYESVILHPIWEDLAPHDPEGLLRYEWANARGCIARFDRDAIEIRLCDTQECPAADVAMAALIVAGTKALAEERWVSMGELDALDTSALAAVLSSAIDTADETLLPDWFLRVYGLGGAAKTTAADLWRHLAEATGVRAESDFRAPLDGMLEKGPLGRRILRRLGQPPWSRGQIREVYGGLADCLARGEVFS